MTRLQIVLAALLPTMAVGGLLIGVVAWRERTAAAQERANAEMAQRQIDEMHHLRDALTAVKNESRQWQERWLADTRKLNGDLAQANEAMAQSAKQQLESQAAVAELAKQLTDLNERLKQLQLQDQAQQQAPKKP
jgi:septal ring factor EnvC (AmiA/AmiB activator)